MQELISGLFGLIINDINFLIDSFNGSILNDTTVSEVNVMIYIFYMIFLILIINLLGLIYKVFKDFMMIITKPFRNLWR